MCAVQSDLFNECNFSVVKLQSNTVVGDTSQVIASLTTASFAKQLENFLKNTCLCELKIKGVLVFFTVHTTTYIDLH